MEPLHPLRLKWGMVLLVLAHLLLVAGSSHAQEAQRVFEPMRGLGNDLGGSDRPSAPHADENQQAPSPVTMPTRPETPATALTFVVTTTADTGSGSFRRAIDSANGNPGIDVIEFNIGGGGVQTITPLTALPYFTGPIIIDGTTQPGYAGSPLIELNGGSAPQGTNGLYLVGGNSLVAA